MFVIYNYQFLTIHQKKQYMITSCYVLMNELPGANFPGKSAALMLLLLMCHSVDVRGPHSLFTFPNIIGLQPVLRPQCPGIIDIFKF